jgi:uncharacterized protein YndB with AHSA1/START domain/quinol monooxygenase YgiN
MVRASAITDGEVALATIIVEAPPERAFDAMNSAEVERWWGAPGLYHMRSWRSDLRAGGSWRVDVCLPEGVILPASGDYLIVEAPHRVRFTRRYDWVHPTLGRTATTVTYRFEPMAGGTRITVRQDEFGSPEAAREHAAGWERSLNLLSAYLGRAQEPHGDDVGAIVDAFRAELHEPAGPLALLVRFDVDKAEAGKVAAAFRAARAKTLNEPGCHAFHLNQVPCDPGRFSVYEQWRNLADFEAHLRTEYVARLRGELDALIVGAPEFHVLIPAA